MQKLHEKSAVISTTNVTIQAPHHCWHSLVALSQNFLYPGNPAWNVQLPCTAHRVGHFITPVLSLPIAKK